MKNEIILYKTQDNKISIDIMLMQDTFWLTQKEIAKLFGVEVPAISKHLNNIYETREFTQRFNYFHFGNSST